MSDVMSPLFLRAAFPPINFPLTHYVNGGVSGLIPVDFGNPESVRDTLLELRDDHRKNVRAQ